MILAYSVYFGLMIALVVFWAQPARQAALGRDPGLETGTVAALLSVALFTVLIGGRYNVGGDFFGYIDYYRYASLGDRAGDVPFEPGFLALIHLLKLFQLPDRSIIVASSFLQILLFSLWLRKKPTISPFVVFACVALLLLDLNNIVRQGIAFFALLLALAALNERRWIVFLAWVVFGGLFHRSALMMLPIGAVLYWLRVPPVSAQIVALAFSYATVGVFFEQVVGAFTFAANILGYSSYTDISRADLAFEQNFNPSLNLGVYLWVAVDIAIILYSGVMSRRYANMGYRYYHNSFLIAALLQPVANTWDFIPFARALFYFVAMRAICVGFTLHYCLVESRRPRDIAAAVGISLAFVMWLAVAVWRGAAWSSPYQFW
ncbi:EpsG family protein [Brevundimonas sp.]|uniref:EpsG family protein n=1 Tax=Brevundimonas sp. TaxID=1871086 RepID=UPI002BD9D8A8|nr:EpsG family protein [Brevundimonas sp.]HWQ88274.1 EpsG family protein [Brevundimonas sp.]